MTDIRWRLLATNDLLGAVYPARTTYGARSGGRSGLVPGYQALRRVVEELRSTVPLSVWIDAGDFAAGPRAYASQGTAGFSDVNALGIDVGTVGNHEFDWGETHLRTHLADVAHSLVCANYPLDLPAATVIGDSGVRVGIIGMTHPCLDQFPGRLHSSSPQVDTAATARRHAQALRPHADIVVLVIHDGVDWTSTASGLSIDTARLAGLCAQLAGLVDVLVAGHTLTEFIGTLHGVAVVQPWPFGASVGVVDMLTDGTLRPWARSVRPDPEDWGGDGEHSEIVGSLARELGNHPGHDNSLSDATVDAMRRHSGADLAVASGWEFIVTQPPVDGYKSALCQGPVSEADILRLEPRPDDTIYVADLDQEQVRHLLDWYHSPSWGPARTSGRWKSATTRVALSAIPAGMYNRTSDQPISWSPTGSGRRDIFRSIVRGS